MNYTPPAPKKPKAPKPPWPVGQLVLVRTDGFVSDAIRAFQSLSDEGTPFDRRWNHVAVMVSRTQCVGAEPGGARKYPVAQWDDYHISHIPYTLQQANQAALFAVESIGDPYSYLDIGLIALALITRQHTPKWLADKLSDDDRFICSELGDAAVTSAGKELVRDGRAFSAVYPSTIATWLKKDGWW